MKRYLLRRIVIFASLIALPACMPCCLKNLMADRDYLTLVYPNHQGCTMQGGCGRLWVYFVYNDTITGTTCIPMQSSEPFGTDCYVTFNKLLGESRFDPNFGSSYTVVHIEGTGVWDTIYSSFIEDPCDKGQWLQPLQRHRYRALWNINGKWYEGPVIYR